MKAYPKRVREALIALTVIAVSASLVRAQGASAPGAAASTTMLQGSAVVEERKTEMTKQLTDQENERHDVEVAGNANQVDSENLRHQEVLQEIEQQNTPAKQLEINQENRNHENTLKALKDWLDEENQRHADNLSQIPARVAQMLAWMFQAGSAGVPGGGAPGGGNYPAQTGSAPPQAPPGTGGTTPGNYANSQPSSTSTGGTGIQETTQGPGTGMAPSSGAGAPLNTSTGNVPAQSAPATPAKPGTPQNPLKGYVSNVPPPSGANGGTTTPGGHSPLFYLNNALNDAVSRIPNGAQTLQQSGQSASQVDQTINKSLNDTARNMQAVRDSMADQMVKKWTQPMSPQTALTEVGTALLTGAAGAGVGAAARTGFQGGTFGAALKAAANAAGQEAKVATGLGSATNAGAGALASRGAISENGGGGPTGNGAGNTGRVPGASSGGQPPNGIGGGGSNVPPEGPGSGTEPGGPEEPWSPGSLAARRSELLNLLKPAMAENGGGGSVLKGAAIQENAGNLANQTVELPPSTDGVLDQPVTIKLGQQLGDPNTKFGAVYDVPNTPLVAKIVKPSSGAAETAARQAQGYQNLQKYNLPTPKMYAYYQGPPGSPSYMLLQNVGSSVAKGPPTAAQAAAARSLLNDIGKRGLVWGDPNQGNYYYYLENGQLKAGVLDPDFIFPWKDYKSIANTQTDRVLTNALMGSSWLAKGGLNASAEEIMNSLADKYFPTSPTLGAASAP